MQKKIIGLLFVMFLMTTEQSFAADGTSRNIAAIVKSISAIIRGQLAGLSLPINSINLENDNLLAQNDFDQRHMDLDYYIR